MYRLFLCLSLLAACWRLCQSAGWSYDGTDGPDHWKDAFPRCGDKKQSPINIKGGEADYDTSLGTFTLQGHDTTANPLTMNLHNNGHTVQVNIGGVNMELSGGSLPGVYKLAQFHFHWGESDTRGSEHTLDGDAYPLEMHLVHYNNLHHNLTVAADKPAGLAVLGFFFELSDSDNTVWNKLLNSFTDVKFKDDQTMVTPFSVKSLLPSNIAKYYRYDGSLTTPPCYESVVWTVFHDAIKISKTQMAKFRELHENIKGDTHSQVLDDNFRPVQPMNGRRVRTNIPASERSAATCGSTHSTLSILALGLMLLQRMVCL